MTFADYFKLADLQRLVQFGKDNPRPEGDTRGKAVDAWYKKSAEAREDIIVKPAMEFFKAKLQSGELKPVPNSQGRSTNFISFWDALVTNTGEEHLRKWGLEAVENILGFILISPSISIYRILDDDEDKPVDIEKVYNDFVAYIDAGNFDWYCVNESMSCGITGEYIVTQFENWTPIIGSGKGGKFVPCVPIEPAVAPQSLTIEFKTGNLVAMDWFRDPDGTLREWTDAKGADDLPNICSEHGVCKSTEFYASLGIVHVFVGNSSPNVFTKEGLIAVGNNWREYAADGRQRYSDADEDGNESEEAYDEYEAAKENPPAGMVDHGRVCTDLWWVTMIERERLIEIFVEQRGEEHRAEIEAYAASDFDVNLQVEPGKYTLHYDGHPSSFYELLDDKTKFQIGTPYFALTKDTA